MKKSILVCISLILCFPLAAQTLNQTQIIGSHNSYKSAMAPEILNYLRSMNPNTANGLEYEHASLEKQLDMGLRNLELDVFHDPQGGRYTQPKGIEMIRKGGNPNFTFDTENKLAVPGLKLFHVQDIDFQSHYLVFAEALQALKTWSNTHPDHHPIFILVNAKDAPVPNTIRPLPFTATALDSIDLEIRTHLGLEKLITPDQVKGSFASLEQGVLNGNWPALDEARGKFLFVLDESEEKIRSYLTKKPGLANAVFFVNLKEGNPEAGFRIINDPVKNETYIQELVRKGYLIRTRADSGTTEARTGDYSKFEKAKSSGAQVISTDYYLPSTLFESNFRISFEGNRYERANPVLNPSKN
ncbi:MAG: phosphatidylinositol-specific phospholipase C1-like protein [Algoriphagus sp.]|nr:phosphatidylinositol-specific phospholipase C1-like protein [Algoriphagus sp.]